MNTFFRTLLISTIFYALALGFVSCRSGEGKDEQSQKEIEAGIIGKWKVVKTNGTETPTNEETIITYRQGGICYRSASEYIPMLRDHVWLSKQEMEYSINGNRLIEIGNIGERQLTIISIDEERMVLTQDKYIYNGKTDETAVSYELTKISVDYSRDIIGLWEGVEMTGEETYGNAEARIEYNADGTYTYYTKSGDDWVDSKNVDNEYMVDGDWLATRWRPETGVGYEYEWWNIESVKDGLMKWTALRLKEDGSRFTTSFTWRSLSSSRSR